MGRVPHPRYESMVPPVHALSPHPSLLRLLMLPTSNWVSGSQGNGRQVTSPPDHRAFDRNVYGEYLGSLPWRWNTVLWYKHHSLPRGAVRKPCRNLENLLRFLKRKNKTVFPKTSQIMKTSKHVALSKTNCISLCCRNILDKFAFKKLSISQSLHLSPYNTRYQSHWKRELWPRLERCLSYSQRLGRRPPHGTLVLLMVMHNSPRTMIPFLMAF